MPRIPFPLRPAAVGCALLLAPFAPGAAAQDVLFTLQGDAVGRRLGSHVAAAGDVDAGGFDDLIVHGACLAPAEFPFVVRVVSGADGGTLHEFCQPGLAYFGVDSAGVGDVNGDDYADILVGAPNQGQSPAGFGSVFLYSGADGSLLYEIQGPLQDQVTPYRFGTSVDGVGDLDGDGAGDFVVGAPASTSFFALNDHVFLHSGATGALLVDIPGNPPAASEPVFGERVAGVGDVDGDGLPDVAASAYLFCEWTDFAQVRVLSGADGGPLHVFDQVCTGLFPLEVGAAGDVNGDGHADIVTGRGASPGKVQVYSGADGVELLAVPGTGGGDEFGHSVDGVGDLDRDGHDDVLVGARGDYGGTGNGPGQAVVLSGRDGAILWTLAGNHPDAWLGASVADAGDVNGDGFRDFVVGAPGDSTAGLLAGQVTVVSGYAPWWDIGHSLPGTGGAPLLEVEGLPVGDTLVELHLANALPGGSAVLVAGFKLAQAPFAGGVLVPSPDVLVGGLAIDAGGELLLAGRFPPGVPSAFPFWLQMLIDDAGGVSGFAVSNALAGATH